MKILLVLLATLLLPVSTQASPNIIISENITFDCKTVSKYACYVNNTKTIYISKNLDAKLLPYIFFHEYGHYLTTNDTKEKLETMFGYLVNSYNKNVYEIAADRFYVFVYHPEFLSPKEKMYWVSKLKTNI